MRYGGTRPAVSSKTVPRPSGLGRDWADGAPLSAISCRSLGNGQWWAQHGCRLSPLLGPSGDGKSPETGIVTQWVECGPPVVWHRKLGTGYGMGAVWGGRFYHFDRHEDQARLTCLDSRNGTIRWMFEYRTDYEDLLGYNHGPRSSPVVDDGRVYLFGPEGMLHCVRADDGKLIWKVDTARKFGVVQNFFGVGSTPVVEGDLLLVMVGGSTAESQTAGRYDQDRVIGNGTGVVAFDKRTGEVKYAVQRRTSQLHNAPVRHDCRPAVVLRLRPRRADRLRAADRQGGFPLSMEGQASRQRQRQYPGCCR